MGSASSNYMLRIFNISASFVKLFQTLKLRNTCLTGNNFIMREALFSIDFDCKVRVVIVHELKDYRRIFPYVERFWEAQSQ